MNPNFALDFRNDQITLLHSQEGVWVQIGIVAVDDPDLEAALGYMRSTALGLSPRGIASKLILPDAAILYTTLGDLSPDPKIRQTQIAVALIGRTPYDVADLVYDWTDEGANAHLAVIARETLDEAEAFAAQYRFNPVAFGAWPQLGPFLGEVDFGRIVSAEDMAAPTEAPQTQVDSEALSASDFEMGDVAQETAADQQIDIAADHVAVDDLPPAQQLPEMAEPIAAQDVSSAETAFSDPAEGIEDAVATAADLDVAPFEEVIVHSDADLTQPVHSDDEPPQAVEPSPIQPDLFAPAPSFAKVMAEDTEEAPMALDVPIDESVADDPAPMSGPSAGKAQTLLTEFAARRESALGQADSVGRVEPVLSAGKTAAQPFAPLSVKPELRAEPAPRIAVQKSGRATEAGLGSKPAIKRPAPKSSASRSALMGFLLTILLLIALFAAATLSTFLTAAWNSYGASTSVASYQPSVSDEISVDLPDFDVMMPSNPAPQTADLAVPTALPDPISSPAPSLALAGSFSESLGDLVPLATPAALPQPLVVAPPNITTASVQTAAPLIVPTAQGVMTPEGVFLIAGQPNVLPAARPESVVAAALQRPAVAQINPSTSAAFADPALAGKKPLIRPKGLAPQTAPIQSDPALAGKRPLTRPETVMAAANAAQIARASLAQSDVERSAMAVTISRLPVARPKGLKAPAEAPQELALATPDVIVPDTPEVRSPEALANAPLEADNEPEVVAPRSSGPRTVVSKNATFKNAINLSKLNLIGVYGSQANRYALIRQSNGRFKKVYVGDRFDGGMVAAITESELRYSKGGQMLALQMPKG